MDKAEKIKKLIAQLKQGHTLSKEESVILEPVTMEMILGYDELSRQKRKYPSNSQPPRHTRS